MSGDESRLTRAKILLVEARNLVGEVADETDSDPLQAAAFSANLSLRHITIAEALGL